LCYDKKTAPHRAVFFVCGRSYLLFTPADQRGREVPQDALGKPPRGDTEEDAERGAGDDVGRVMDEEIHP